MTFRPTLVLALIALPGLATAHVSATPGAAPAGAYQVVRFGLGHGCEGRATTALTLQMPAALGSARPQPKPGWTMEVARDGERVAAITWRGALPADQFEEFLVQVRLPPQTGPLRFPAIQTCGDVTVRWDETAPAGGPRPKYPAPTVSLTPAAQAEPAAAPHH